MPEAISQSELVGLTGRVLGPSKWLVVEQERIQLFADATNDHQFIHVDPIKAASGPFGGTIAHGFLTLSLVAPMMEEIAVVPVGLQMGVNYGLNRVRFLQPVAAGARVRLVAKVLDVTTKGPGRFLMTSECTVEIAEQENPALIAETLVLFVCQPEERLRVGS